MLLNERFILKKKITLPFRYFLFDRSFAVCINKKKNKFSPYGFDTRTSFVVGYTYEYCVYNPLEVV